MRGQSSPASSRLLLGDSGSRLSAEGAGQSSPFSSRLLLGDFESRLALKARHQTSPGQSEPKASDALGSDQPPLARSPVRALQGAVHHVHKVHSVHKDHTP